MKVIKNLKNKKINISQLDTWFDFKKSIYSMIQYQNLNWTGDTFKGIFSISGTINNVILGQVISWTLTQIQLLDENEKQLSGQQLKTYIEEKAKKCPYTGTIYVNVYALNLREKNTKYSKRLALLRKWTSLKVLSCEKNLKSNSWWYKVKTPSGKIWWVSTIWVSK